MNRFKIVKVNAFDVKNSTNSEKAAYFKDAGDLYSIPWVLQMVYSTDPRQILCIMPHDEYDTEKVSVLWLLGIGGTTHGGFRVGYITYEPQSFILAVRDSISNFFQWVSSLFDNETFEAFDEINNVLKKLMEHAARISQEYEDVYI